MLRSGGKRAQSFLDVENQDVRDTVNGHGHRIVRDGALGGMRLSPLRLMGEPSASELSSAADRLLIKLANVWYTANVRVILKPPHQAYSREGGG